MTLGLFIRSIFLSSLNKFLLREGEGREGKEGGGGEERRGEEKEKCLHMYCTDATLVGPTGRYTGRMPGNSL
jgi:hypothetical protein